MTNLNKIRDELADKYGEQLKAHVDITLPKVDFIKGFDAAAKIYEAKLAVAREEIEKLGGVK